MPLLGGHEDDAVGGTGAVDGGGTRVFQNGEILDVIGIQVVESTLVGNETVDDEQRRVVRRGGDTTDVEVRALTVRVEALALDDDVRRGTLERLGDIGDRTVFEEFRTDGFHRTGGTLPGRRTVADDDDLVEKFRILFQHDPGKVGAGGEFQFHETHGGKYENVVRRGVDGKTTIEPRHGSRVGTFYQDAHADQGFSVDVHDGTFDRYLRSRNV